tara:strand:- start:887 stop:1021 length:135 start_codon:yes stop_codon:yes gene_type:complete
MRNRATFGWRYRARQAEQLFGLWFPAKKNAGKIQRKKTFFFQKK